MAKDKACRICKTIFTGDKCPNCGSEQFIENYKGKTIVLNPEESEIAKNIGIKSKGTFAVKAR
jgi:DNA-directed RNA polymerase subunit E"